MGFSIRVLNVKVTAFQVYFISETFTIVFSLETIKIFVAKVLPKNLISFHSTTCDRSVCGGRNERENFPLIVKTPLLECLV